MRFPWRWMLLAGLLAGVLNGSGCSQGDATGGGAPGGEVKLVITGSSTVAPLAGEIAKRFEKVHPGVRVDVQSGGSSRGVADVRRGRAHIGMVSRPLKTGEEELVAVPIARDGISIIVHRDNPVTRLSDDQIVAIYRGEITNWYAVGGDDRPITVVNKAAGHSTLELFLAHFGLKESEIRAQVVIGDNEHGIKTVAGNPDAIGYVSIGTAAYDAAQGVPIRLLPVAGVAATTENVAAGRFPISRPLNLVTVGEADGWAATFIAFAASGRVADLVTAQSFVPADG